jgi:hypothetical protein
LAKFEYVLPDELKKFNVFLASPLAVEHFQLFLRDEFSVENILFWKEASAFSQNFAPSDGQGKESKHNEEDMFKTATGLYTRYVDPDGLCALNLPHDMIAELEAVFSKPEQQRNKEIHSQMFEKGKSEIVKLMARDSFFRFRKSVHCMNLIEALVEA